MNARLLLLLLLLLRESLDKVFLTGVFRLGKKLESVTVWGFT